MAQEITRMEHKLREHEHTHPNLVSLWRKRLTSQKNKMYTTIQSYDKACKLFATNPDPQIATLALLMCLLHKTI